MCEQLNVVSEFGYKLASVAKNACYFTFQNGNQTANPENEIKFITEFRFARTTVIDGLNLYLPQYLTTALNATMRIVPEKDLYMVSFKKLEIYKLFYKVFTI